MFGPGVLGQLCGEHFQWERARRDFKLALQLDPSDAIAHQWYGLLQWYSGDPRFNASLVKMGLPTKY